MAGAVGIIVTTYLMLWFTPDANSFTVRRHFLLYVLSSCQLSPSTELPTCIRALVFSHSWLASLRYVRLCRLCCLLFLWRWLRLRITLLELLLYWRLPSSSLLQTSLSMASISVLPMALVLFSPHGKQFHVHRFTQKFDTPN
jgi:hypothetical protein